MSFLSSLPPALIIFLPLLGSALAGFGAFFPKQSSPWGDRLTAGVTSLLVLASAVLACGLFLRVADGAAPFQQTLGVWLAAGDLHADWAIKVDALSAVMMATVSVISACVHFYAIGYMHGDHSVPRFMSYLSLFTFFMLSLVSADNLVQMFFGWEGVGLCSYLLINFWHDRPAANSAGIKAFLVNRVGDAGFVLGIIGCYAAFGSVRFDEIFARLGDVAGFQMSFGSLTLPTADVLALLLFIGAVGKSAQLGLHVWLPDAMEGPTPVSALIHAATMVTAGVFMLARLSPLFDIAPFALTVVALLGGGTALFGAITGVFQTDIKRVIAYSTMSQLGYMFFAAGVGAYEASIFHLMTHAFFKALLFLGAGAVIHAVAGKQDLRQMGGLWRKLPVTYGLMWIGSLALAGIGIAPYGGFAGFYSKDAILEAAQTSPLFYGSFVYVLGLVAATLTAFYSLRLLLLAFHGMPHDEEVKAHAHEAPLSMLLPMLPLGVGALAAGAWGAPYFVGTKAASFWQGAVTATHEASTEMHGLAAQAPLMAALLGFAVAAILYIGQRKRLDSWAAAFDAFLSFARSGFGIDALYNRVFVRGAEKLGVWLGRYGDDRLIDGLGPDGVGLVAQKLSRRASLLQSGFVYHYAFAMVLGLAAVLTWFAAAWYWIWR